MADVHEIPNLCPRPLSEPSIPKDAATASWGEMEEKARLGQRTMLSTFSNSISTSPTNISPRPANTQAHKDADPLNTPPTPNALPMLPNSDSQALQSSPRRSPITNSHVSTSLSFTGKMDTGCNSVSSNMATPPSSVTLGEQFIEQCGECMAKFTDMNSYLNHKCSADGEEDAGSVISPVSEPNPQLDNSMEDEILSDVESFDGKIVYNPDGSAYIIEGESDLSDTESLREVPKVEGTIVDQRGKVNSTQIPSFPQVASAFYIQRNPAFYNSYYMLPQENKPRVEAPIMHSYRVYDVRTKKDGELNHDDGNTDSKDGVSKGTKLNLPSGDVATVPTKPILMCFICKLSFGYGKSFTAHAVGEHNMTLNEDERELMSRKNASAIIQGVGKDKEPLMSFLEPTSVPPHTSNDTSSLSRPVYPPTLYNTGADTSESTSVSYVYSSSKVSPMPQSPHVSTGCMFSRSNSGYGDVKEESMSSSQAQMDKSHGILGARTATDSSSMSTSTTDSHPEGRSTHMNAQTDTNSRSPRAKQQSAAGEDTGFSRLHCEMEHRTGGGLSPPSPNHVRDIKEENMDDSPELRLSPGSSQATSPSAMSSMMSHQMNLSTASSVAGLSMSQQSPTAGIVIRGVCEDHPHGNITGVDCQKCEAMLGNSRTMGGQMTMMHSRNSCKTLKCPKCNWHYKYQETLEIHMKEKHPENDAQCVYCITNQAHPRLARGEVYTCGYKPYRCEVCNYSTTTKGNLSIHMQSDKHINNMQEMQNGTPEIKMAPAPPPTCMPPSPNPNSADAKKNKPKPTWRCDVCNYETNVARNLRIHMTSEKHTHNMMVLQQNVKHMQRDMQFQLGQMAMLGQDPSALLAIQQGQLPPGMPFPYDPAMFMVPPPGMMPDSAVDLSKQEPNGLPPPKCVPASIPMQHADVKNNNNEPSKMFQCSVCNVYSTDSVESLHRHMQLDRSKHGDQENVTVVGGTYMCQLCQYKTSLKANFQLHCKTDKHIQRLQLVNHIREGGPGNEWRLKYMNMSQPVQVRCSACDYYTNSIHKLQLHLSTPRHEANAKLFHHLQMAETKLASIPADRRYFHCLACSFSSRSRLALIQHVRSLRHMRGEATWLQQLQEQGQEHEHTMENIFLVKHLKDGETVKFEEVGEYSMV